LHQLLKVISQNHAIKIYDTAELYGEKGKFRVLEFSDEAVQGALDLIHPERIVLEYPRAIIHLMEFNNPLFEDVFIIGHGIGTIAGHYPEKQFKIAELDEQVVEYSKRWFGYTGDNVIVGDGREVLSGEPSQAYDFIILDAFTAKGTPQHLISREFFGLTREKLNAGGSILMNLIGKGEKDTLIHAIHQTVREEYAYTQAFALLPETGNDIQNIVIIAGNKPIGYQARHMAGFTEIELGQGHIIRDCKPRP
jgi:spermidine synthase